MRGAAEWMALSPMVWSLALYRTIQDFSFMCRKVYFSFTVTVSAKHTLLFCKCTTQTAAHSHSRSVPAVVLLSDEPVTRSRATERGCGSATCSMLPCSTETLLLVVCSRRSRRMFDCIIDEAIRSIRAAEMKAELAADTSRRKAVFLLKMGVL